MDLNPKNVHPLAPEEARSRALPATVVTTGPSLSLDDIYYTLFDIREKSFFVRWSVLWLLACAIISQAPLRL